MSPAQSQFRRIGLMDRSTFEQCIKWIKIFVQRGTQTEINLFGVGEPLMNSNLVEYVKALKKEIPLCIAIHTNTNGGLMNEELAKKLIDAGITQIDITGHNHLWTAQTVRLFGRLGLKFHVTYDFALVANDWAGQVNWFKSELHYPCPWLNRGQLFIAWNGDILQCCLDAKCTNILGNIFKNEPDDIECKPFELCENCHQSVPETGNEN
jgi:MoaA/NifB/PqqE/SkfB family radical SAM enzyme